MTQAAKLKSVIRTRAKKTGESYTAARRQVLASRPAVREISPEPDGALQGPGASLALPVKEPRIPRGEVSNAAVLKRTGHDLAYWFKVLDKFGKANGHTTAAEFLYSKHKVAGWYAQMITVTWERSRGLRQENQSCTGTFQVSVSRSIAASTDWIVDFINDPKARREWLSASSPALRKAMEDAFEKGKMMETKKPGYARMRYKWLSSVVELRAYGKPSEKSSLVADSSDLPDADAVAVRREAFAQALDRLRDIAAGI